MQKTIVCTPEFVADLKENNPQLKKYTSISTILVKYHKFLLQKMCEERDGIYLPILGAHMFIGCFQQKEEKFKEKRLSNENSSIRKGWRDQIDEDLRNYNIH